MTEGAVGEGRIDPSIRLRRTRGDGCLIDSSTALGMTKGALGMTEGALGMTKGVVGVTD